jgi:hypothetical protein
VRRFHAHLRNGILHCFRTLVGLIRGFFLFPLLLPRSRSALAAEDLSPRSHANTTTWQLTRRALPAGEGESVGPTRADVCGGNAVVSPHPVQKLSSCVSLEVLQSTGVRSGQNLAPRTRFAPAPFRFTTNPNWRRVQRLGVTRALQGLIRRFAVSPAVSLRVKGSCPETGPRRSRNRLIACTGNSRGPHRVIPQQPDTAPARDLPDEFQADR